MNQNGDQVLDQRLQNLEDLERNYRKIAPEMCTKLLTNIKIYMIFFFPFSAMIKLYKKLQTTNFFVSGKILKISEEISNCCPYLLKQQCWLGSFNARVLFQILIVKFCYVSTCMNVIFSHSCCVNLKPI